MSLSSSPGLPEDKYSFGGKNLGELLCEFRDRGSRIEALGGFSEFCARLYSFVYDEELTLSDAFNELGRQSGGRLYTSRFWIKFSDGVFGDVLQLGDDKRVSEKLIAELMRLRNIHFTENPGN